MVQNLQNFNIWSKVSRLTARGFFGYNVEFVVAESEFGIFGYDRCEKNLFANPSEDLDMRTANQSRIPSSWYP
jgi:hypothetical protein